MIAAPSEAQEVPEIAREILRLVKEDGIPFHEMAILLRNADLYGNLIQETFQSLGIPLYLQGGTSLWQTPEGKSALLLIDLVGSNFQRPQVMEFLTFAPIVWSRFFKEEPPPSQWDLISRQAGIVEGRNQWMIYDKKERDIRPVCFRDIALLFPALSGIEIYEEALKDRGIPFRLDGGKEFYLRQEVRSLLCCLRVLDDPADEISLVAALRSPFFGFSDEEIFLFVSLGNRLN